MKNIFKVVAVCLLMAGCMPDYVVPSSSERFVIRDNYDRQVGTVEETSAGCVVYRDNYSRPSFTAC